MYLQIHTINTIRWVCGIWNHIKSNQWKKKRLHHPIFDYKMPTPRQNQVFWIPISAKPIFSSLKICNAMYYSLGAVITQSGHPVAFHSKTFNNTVRRYSTYEKELYVIVQALKQWRHYILGKETIILTDHKPLQFTPTQSKL